MFQQPGGCCDGSAPIRFTQVTLIAGSSDVHLGDLETGAPEVVPVSISREQYAY